MTTTGRVDLKGVHKQFGDFVALNRIDLRIEPVEFFALLGPSGSGKTTTLRMIAGLDTPDAIELLYHWALDRLDCVVTVRTRLDRDKPEIASIAGACAAAEWIEREIWELLGVQFRNHPDLRHLLLSDDWPAGKFPLRRDYQK